MYLHSVKNERRKIDLIDWLVIIQFDIYTQSKIPNVFLALKMIVRVFLGKQNFF